VKIKGLIEALGGLAGNRSEYYGLDIESLSLREP
jgi:hypothetical protein